MPKTPTMQKPASAAKPWTPEPELQEHLQPAAATDKAPADPPSAITAAGSIDQFPPEAIFVAGKRYTAEEIHELAGIEWDLITRAAAAKEISSVYSPVRTNATGPAGGAAGKAWPGERIANWIRDRNLTLNPSDFARRECEIFHKSEQQQAEQQKRREEAAAAESRRKAAIAQRYCEIIGRSTATRDMLELLITMDENEHTPQEVVSIIQNEAPEATPRPGATMADVARG